MSLFSAFMGFGGASSYTKSIFITTTGTSTFTVPSDYIELVSVECIGAGGGTAGQGSGGGGSGGGGGGAYSAITSLSLLSGQNITCGVGAGGTSGATTGDNGVAGGDTFFNGTNINDCSVGAKGGGASVTGSNAAGAGGLASASVGTTKFNGGTGGTGAGNNAGGGGGGGAAGPGGAGGTGGNASGTTGGAGGGSAGTTAGGNASGSTAGTAGGTGGAAGGANGVPGITGGAGTYWVSAATGAAAGPGGGGGAANQGNGNQAGSGGAFGGGAGASNQTQGTNTAVGGNGLIVFTYKGTLPPSVADVSLIAHTSFTKTASLSNVYTLNYAGNLSAGTFVVIVTTVRTTNTGVQNMTVTDSAGNTYTQAVVGTQSNNITSTSILFCKLTNAVTSATTITVTGPTGTYQFGQYASVFVLNNVIGTLDSTNTGTNGVGTQSNTVTISSGRGIVIHGVSTGAIGPPSFTSVSAGWSSQYNLTVSGCSQYSASFVANGLGSNYSASNTITLSSGNTAGVMASFI